MNNTTNTTKTSTKTTSKAKVTKVTKNPTSKVTRSTSTRKTKVKAPMIETNIIPINSNTAPAALIPEINPAVLINPVDLHPFELRPLPAEEPKVKTSVKKRGRRSNPENNLSVSDVCEFFADGVASKDLDETNDWNGDLWYKWNSLNDKTKWFCFNVKTVETKIIKLLNKVSNEDREAIKNMLKSLIDNH